MQGFKVEHCHKFETIRDVSCTPEHMSSICKPGLGVHRLRSAGADNDGAVRGSTFEASQWPRLVADPTASAHHTSRTSLPLMVGNGERAAFTTATTCSTREGG
jgi:hypothetical protein